MNTPHTFTQIRQKATKINIQYLLSDYGELEGKSRIFYMHFTEGFGHRNSSSWSTVFDELQEKVKKFLSKYNKNYLPQLTELFENYLYFLL
jgi:hypothetical protein